MEGAGVTPYYEENGITIYHGDCREIASDLSFDCVLSDPPWGTNTATDARRFTRRASTWWAQTNTNHAHPHSAVTGDKEEFNPLPWIDRPSILWGANNFAQHLPHSAGWLVWDKRLGVEDVADKGWPLSEAELAWTNVRGSVRVFRNRWMGLLRDSEQGQFYHPTQKPIALMRWCIDFLPGGIVIDPFMGSGSTLVAAHQLRHQAIGIEIEERYCEIAVQRLAQGVLAFGESS